MNIVVRVDASQQIGTGHFMRCLTLADILSQRGAQIRFVSRHLPDYLQNMLRDKSYEFRILESTEKDKIDNLAHSHWLGTTQRSDAEEMLQLLSDQTWEWLVVDNYALDARWESVMRKAVKNILVIDDIADRQHDCDLLLDQNFYTDMASRYAGKVPEHCRLLLGPRYALLRDEFRQLHQKVKPRSGPVKRIFVFFGGVDINNYTGRAIDALVRLDMNGLHVDVVIGSQHPYRGQIQAACAEHKFTCYVQTNRMAELMAAADLAIGAGGSATWERCCLGLPTLTVSIADNQIAIAKGLDVYSACQYVGSQQIATVNVLNKAVIELLKDNNRLQAISTQAYSFVDGLGVDRVFKELLG
jgi:UDP-2,4-diacetamido-2,4,6-trideoxy-beta-L-altropyranose hydrolase